MAVSATMLAISAAIEHHSHWAEDVITAQMAPVLELDEYFLHHNVPPRNKRLHGSFAIWEPQYRKMDYVGVSI